MVVTMERASWSSVIFEPCFMSVICIRSGNYAVTGMISEEFGDMSMVGLGGYSIFR